MICNLPSQTVLCSRRQARIVMPSLVMEFIGTIWQSAPHERGDRVDHHPIFVFGDLHFGALRKCHISWRRSKISGRFLFQGATGSTSGRARFAMSHQVRFCDETLWRPLVLLQATSRLEVRFCRAKLVSNSLDIY